MWGSGAAGAVWGFSEVVGLRTDGNKEEWRWVAIAVGIVFFLRWLLYIYQHLQYKRLYVYTHQDTTRKIMRKKTEKKKGVREGTRSAAIAAAEAATMFQTAAAAAAPQLPPEAPSQP